MMILISEGRASRAQASRVIPCTSEPKSRAHTRRLPMCPNLGTAGSQFLGLLGNLLLGTLAWEPVPGNLLGTCSWEPCLETNLAWEPLPGNPIPNLAPCGFGCSEGFSWKRKPFLGTRLPTLRAVRIWLPRPAPEPLLWLKTPSLRCWGKRFWKAAIPKS